MKNVATLAVITLAVGVSSFFAFQAARIETIWFWLLAELPIILVAIYAIVRARSDGELASMLRPSWGDFSLGFVGAIALFALSFAFTKLVLAPGTPREQWIMRLYLQLGNPDQLRAHAVLVAIALIVAAIAEEIAWRGLVTQLFAEMIGSRRAWIASTILYSLAYIPTMWSLRTPSGQLNPLLPIAALGAGFVWSLMARVYNRITPSIVAHALFDWAVVMMFRLWGTSV